MQRSGARMLLTIGLAYVFVALGVSKLLEPLFWIGWVPLSFEGVLGLTRGWWLQVVAVLEILLGLLLFIPRRSFQRVVLSIIILHLLHIILMLAGPTSDIGVRDTGLLIAALALWFLLSPSSEGEREVA